MRFCNITVVILSPVPIRLVLLVMAANWATSNSLCNTVIIILVCSGCDSCHGSVPSEAQDSGQSRSSGRLRPEKNQRAAGRRW